MQTQVLEDIKVEYKAPSVQIFILKINNTAFKIKGKSYDCKILGKPLFKWVEDVCKPYSTQLINCTSSASVSEVVFPHLTDADVTCVFYADTPLLKHSTIESAIDYLTFKNLEGLQLGRGFVFNTKSLKTNANIKIEKTFLGSEEEFFAVTNLKALADASKILQNRINTYYMNNGVYLQDPNSIIIEPNVEIGNNVKILSGTSIKGNSVVFDDVVIKENCVIDNSIIETGAIIFEFNKILNSTIKDNCLILSFNSITANSLVLKNATIESFCNIKSAKVEENAEIESYTNLEDSYDEENY